MKEKRKAVVLLSGGLDSTTALAIAQRDGFSPYALSFAYGQRHAHELVAAAQIARTAGVAEHKTAQIDLRVFGGSALTADMDVPKDRSLAEMEHGIPSTYVPARNTIFLAFAIGWGEVVGAQDIFIGVNELDYSGYPDCRPAFIEAFENLANLATSAGVQGHARFRIHAPLMRLGKAAIIRLGLELGVDYGVTSTCYDPDVAGRACGRCDACQLRLKGFAENGISDPAPYVGKS
jgi:7-cyano-7-deazaguanine synthase